MSLIKDLARSTRSWRIAWGLAREPNANSAEISRSQSRRALPGGRVHAMEADIDRLLGSWNQYIPQLLSGMGAARRMAARTDAVLDRVEGLEVEIERLNGLVGSLESRLESTEKHARAESKNCPG